MKRQTARLLTLLFALTLSGWAATAAAGPSKPSLEAASGPRLDVVFALDSTGSMANEIAEAKERIRQIASSLSTGDPAPRIRFGVVTYRDRGDEYVTRRSPLSTDVEATWTFLSGVKAGGGGDTPEAVVQALHESIRDSAWDRDDEVMRIVYLIGDAPPKRYEDDPNLDEDLKWALQNGIVIHALGCGGLGEAGQAFFRKVSLGTEGRYYALSQRAGSAAFGVRTVEEVRPRTARPGPGDLARVVTASAKDYTSSVGTSYEGAGELGPALKLESLGPEHTTSSLSGLLGEHARLITDQASWQAVWAAHVSLSPGPRSRPEVDFKRFELVVISGQGRLSGLKAYSAGDARLLQYELRPGEEQVARFLLLPRDSRPLRFERRNERG